jgi:hypothetical protein
VLEGSRSSRPDVLTDAGGRWHVARYRKRPYFRDPRAEEAHRTAPLPLCVFGMTRGDVDEPYRVVPVVDDVADAATAGHFVLPLLHLAVVVTVRGKVPAQPVLAVMIGTRARAGP